MTSIQSFSDPVALSLAEVGGKGLSLIRMTRAGVAVPPGFVLTVAFFEPWLSALRAAPEWTAFLDAIGAPTLKMRCDDLKARCAALSFSAEQRAAIDAALGPFPEGALFAVRSSSPEEDLAGSSFAGGYETVLGVSRAALEAAARRAFASCLDARVAIYKQENGFDVQSPRIAVVVQQQIASEVAGVGFSLDPVSNAYDEAVFNANWGLGETVVAGLASPDLFRVDKVAREVIGRQTGKKETSIWLLPGGGTEERPDPRQAELTLTDEQILALTEQLVRIEGLYGVPMDIEWAFAGGRLYLLQARPVTTHLALPDEMVTTPGAPRRLYWDLTVSVQGFFKPLSAMASDCWSALLGAGSAVIFGSDGFADRAEAPILVSNGRIYANLSNVLAFAALPTLLGLIPKIDPVAAAALATIDEDTYRSKDAHRPVPWNTILHAPQRMAQMLEARLLPEHARQGIDRALEKCRRDITTLAAEPRPFGDFARAVVARAATIQFESVVPLLIASKIAMSRLRGIFEGASPDEEALLSRLDQSLPGNVTVEMGLALFELSQHLPRGLDLDALLAGLRDATLPADFLEGMRSFLDRYGHRGPGEIDVATPRYREQPRMLLSQLASLSRTGDPEATPQAIYDRSQRERHEAFEQLGEIAHAKGWLASKRFASLYRVVVELGGVRETPKFWLVFALDKIRGRALAEGEALVAAGRLDARDHVFDLTFDELTAGIADRTVDLRATVHERRVATERLLRFKELPRLIDSRGKILRPAPQPRRPGELGGFPISPGVVRGAVKVLHAPDEKPLHPGEILVARATDPGWTPLFVNAAAVILEVGGLMQHGALVAREYGKPCVAGVDAATTRLRDGERVEVDGAAGIIRRLEPEAAQAAPPAR